MNNTTNYLSPKESQSKPEPTYSHARYPLYMSEDERVEYELKYVAPYTPSYEMPFTQGQEPRYTFLT